MVCDEVNGSFGDEVGLSGFLIAGTIPYYVYPFIDLSPSQDYELLEDRE